MVRTVWVPAQHLSHHIMEMEDRGHQHQRLESLAAPHSTREPNVKEMLDFLVVSTRTLSNIMVKRTNNTEYSILDIVQGVIRRLVEIHRGASSRKPMPPNKT